MYIPEHLSENFEEPFKTKLQIAVEDILEPLQSAGAACTVVADNAYMANDAVSEICHLGYDVIARLKQDPIETFFAYAGQYQPEAAGLLRDTEPPAFVAIVGKPRTYETDDGTTNVSLRPESMSVVDAVARDRWVVETAERTLERIEAFDEPGNEYAQMAKDQYEMDVDDFRVHTVSALEQLDEKAGEDAEASIDV